MTTSQVPNDDTDSDTISIIGSQTRRAMLSSDRAACAGPDVAGWTRRGFLGVLGAIGGGTLAGCVVGGSRGAGSDSASIVGDLGAANKKKKRSRPVTADAGYTPTPPYTLDAVCELSEDYFLVQNHSIDLSKDKVIAYSRAHGQVEAMVLQDGVVKQLYRDPTQPGGWAVYALPDATGVSDMVAAVGQVNATAVPYLQVCYLKETSKDRLIVTTQPDAPIGSGAPSFRSSTVAWNANAGPLAVTMGTSHSVNPNTEPLVSAMVPSSEGADDAQLCWHFGSQDSGVLTGFGFDPSNGDDSWSLVRTTGHYTETFTGGFVLYIATADGSLDLWQLLGASGGTMTRLTDLPALTVPQLDRSNTVVSDIVAATNLQPSATYSMPVLLVWTRDSLDGALGGNPQLWAVSWGGGPNGTNHWVWTNLGVPPKLAEFDIPVTTALAPRTSGAGFLLDVFVSWGGTLQVARQIEQDGTADVYRPAFTPFIPLQPNVATMTSQPAASSGNELIVVGADGTLETLEKNPLTGWTGTPIHLPSEEMQQDSAYRVQLTASDSWNVGLAGSKLSITASSQAVARVEGNAAGNPNTVVLGQTPVTVTTDGQGEVILALLADGLSAPTLTITAQTNKGDKLPGPLTVYPSGAVNTYLSGDKTQQLNYLQPLDAATLTDAKTPQTDNAPVDVVAPDAGTGTNAADAVANMTGAATAARDNTKLGAAPAMPGRPDGGRGVHPRRHRHGHGVGTGVSVQAGQSNINNWSLDVLHAIKKGAAKVSTVTKDLEHDVYVLAVDLADWTDHEVSITVHDIEDAAHVIHAEFNRLGGEIVHAVKWLEAEVIGVFKSAKVLSDHFEQWISDFSGFATTTLASDKDKTETWLKNEQNDVTTKLTTLAGRYGAKTTLSNMAQNSPGRLGTRRRPAPGGSRPAQAAPPRDSADDQQPPPHGDWFYNKIKHELAGSGLKIDLSSVPDLKDKIVAFGEKSLAHSPGFQKVFKDELWMGYIYGVVHHPDDVDGMFVQTLLQKLLKVINDGFDFAENIVAEAFDLLHDLAVYIPTMLSGTTLKNLPILGALMKLIGLGDVSIGRVTNLIFAFPTALVYKIAHGAQAQPFASTGVARRQGVGDEASDLQICAASVMGTWAVFDTVSAAFTAVDQDGGILFTGIDITAPLIVTILTTPATKNGEPFFAPPVSGNAADVMGFLAWVLGAIPAFTAALPLVIEKLIGTGERDTKDFIQMSVWFCSLTGVLALVFGMVANSQKDAPKGADYAGAVLNNMPTIAGAGLTDVIKEVTEGISVVVAMALTLICGEIGAGVYGIDG